MLAYVVDCVGVDSILLIEIGNELGVTFRFLFFFGVTIN